MNINTVLGDSRGGQSRRDTGLRDRRRFGLNAGLTTLMIGLICILLGGVAGYAVRSYWTIQVQPIANASPSPTWATDEPSMGLVPISSNAIATANTSDGENELPESPSLDNVVASEMLLGQDFAEESESGMPNAYENSGDTNEIATSAGIQPFDQAPSPVDDSAVIDVFTNGWADGAVSDDTEIIPATAGMPRFEDDEIGTGSIFAEDALFDIEADNASTNGKEKLIHEEIGTNDQASVIPEPADTNGPADSLSNMAGTNGQAEEPFDSIGTNGSEEPEDSWDDESGLDEDVAQEDDAEVHPQDVRKASPCGAMGFILWTVTLLGLSGMRRSLS